jgi:hypothetical protein
MVKMYCELMDHPGYLAHDAGRLAGVLGDRIGQWARWGHIRASISDGDPHVYAFEDVAEALAVHLLLEAGHHLPAVRRAVDRLGGPSGWPLSSGADVFSTFGALALNGRVDARKLLRGGGWPSHVTGVTEVEVDPARAGGRACVRGRRVTVQDAVADPDAYGLTPEQIEAAKRWWACDPS